MLRFAYLEEFLTGPVPPTLPANSVVRYRPLIPITIIGPGDVSFGFERAILDTGADDTVFPIDVAKRLGIPLRPLTGHGLRWRGQLHAIRFGDVELALADSNTICQWRTVIGFSPAAIRYPILGQAGCLRYFDARFLGADLAVELEVNRDFPGTCA